MNVNAGDEITLAATVMETWPEANGVIVFTKNGTVFAIKESDIKTIRPAIKNDGVDKRRGN